MHQGPEKQGYFKKTLFLINSYIELIECFMTWLNDIDPGMRRRIKGLQLIIGYGIAAAISYLWADMLGIRNPEVLSSLATGFSLFAGVMEWRSTRRIAIRDLALFVLTAILGAFTYVYLRPLLLIKAWPGPEFALVIGAFSVAYLRPFGLLAAGIGSQMYVGQLLAYSAGLTCQDRPMILLSGTIAAIAAIVPRLLSGSTELRAVAASPLSSVSHRIQAAVALRMGLHAGLATLALVLLNDAVNLKQSTWAITACIYVIASTPTETIDRVRRRILGTAIGVPLGLICVPWAMHAHVFAWIIAAAVMMLYAIALPTRYDIACGSFAFVLVITLAASGETSMMLLASRAWETLIGATLSLFIAVTLLPIRATLASNHQANS